MNPDETKTVTQTESVDEVLEDGVDSVETADDNTATEAASPEPQPDKNTALRERLAEQRFEADTTAVETAEEEAALDEAENEDSSKEQTYTVKVDGEEREVSYDDLIKAYQIDGTAQKRLQEASELRRAVEEERTELQNLRAEIETKADSEEPAPTPDFDVHEYITAIREGEDEAAIEVTEKLLRSVRTSSDVRTAVDAALQERDAQVQAQEEQRKQQEARDAETVFQTTYAQELETNPDFFALACLEDGKLEQDSEWSTRSIQDRYIEAGKRAQAWSRQTDAVPARTQKIKQKAASAALTSRTTRQVPKTPVEETSSDIVRSIAKARGQRL